MESTDHSSGDLISQKESANFNEMDNTETIKNKNSVSVTGDQKTTEDKIDDCKNSRETNNFGLDHLKKDAEKVKVVQEETETANVSTSKETNPSQGPKKESSGLTTIPIPWNPFDMREFLNEIINSITKDLNEVSTGVNNSYFQALLETKRQQEEKMRLLHEQAINPKKLKLNEEFEKTETDDNNEDETKEDEEDGAGIAAARRKTTFKTVRFDVPEEAEQIDEWPDETWKPTEQNADGSKIPVWDESLSADKNWFEVNVSGSVGIISGITGGVSLTVDSDTKQSENMWEADPKENTATVEEAEVEEAEVEELIDVESTDISPFETKKENPDAVEPQSGCSYNCSPEVQRTVEFCQARTYERCSRCKWYFSPEETKMHFGCGHRFHDSCAFLWAKSLECCPICRYQINTKDLKNE